MSRKNEEKIFESIYIWKDLCDLINTRSPENRTRKNKVPEDVDRILKYPRRHKKNEDLNFPEKPTIREITIDLFEKYIFDEKSSTKNKLVFIDPANASEEIYFVEKIIFQNAWEIVFLWHRIIKEEPEKWTKISVEDYKKKKRRYNYLKKINKKNDF